MKQVLKSWLPLAGMITLVCLIIYGTVQQTYRSNANDPQFQMAEDAVHALEQGIDPRQIISSKQTEISNSLLPFTIIYDENGKPIASDGVLDGRIPSMPEGVLDFTRLHEQDAITWQPRPGVRNALVIMSTPGVFKGFVAAGRSLRLVEMRESILIKQILAGWFFSVVALLVLVVGAQRFLK